MDENKLYFITGQLYQSYIYKYILATNKKQAIRIFGLDYPEYFVEEIKIISPSKNLIKKYKSILNRINQSK